jgi:mono/diheme cytochrome c family protein
MSSPFYRTQAWRQLRAECLARQPRCATAGCGARSVVADHVIPRSRGGADTLDNLVGRCLACHNARRGTAEPVLRGCDATGTPRDRGHWWNAQENVSGLSAGTAPHHSQPVSCRVGKSHIRGRR